MTHGMTRALARSGCATALVALLLAAVPARADTLLRLSDTGEVSVKPDTLVGTLRAELRAATAAAAQQKVNALIAEALAQAKKQSGITSETGNYYVFHLVKPKDEWQASQTITLRGQDGPALLRLVGTLQHEGLAMSGLDWQLSPKLARTTHHAAVAVAVKQLRAKVDQAAALLGLKFATFKEVDLSPSPNHVPMPVMRMMAAAPAATPPSAVQGSMTISATVQAVAVLK